VGGRTFMDATAFCRPGIREGRSDLEGLAFTRRFSRGAASILLTEAKGLDEEVRRRLSGGPGEVASKPRPFSPSAENGLDSSFALLSLRSRNRARSLLIRVSRATTPSPGKKEEMGASLAGLRSKAAGVPRGMAPLVAGRSPRRGGRERSERWKGEREAFSLQEDDVGNERADDSKPRASAEFRSAEKNVEGTA